MNTENRWDERGFAHILLVVIGVVVIAGVGVVGWKVASTNKSTTKSSSTSNTTAKGSSSSSGSSVAADASCLAQYHDANICHFASNSTSFEKTAYTATLTLVQNGSTTSTSVLKNDGNGNTELTGSGGGDVINAITLDNNMYVQSNNTGPWIQYPSGSAAPASNPTSNMNIGVGSAGISFKSLGTAACGSLTCYKYQVTSTSPLDAGATQDVWFDTSSYKLREWYYSTSAGNSTDMTISYGPVSITKPSPIESLSASLGQ
jgi:hypothetical protein